MFLRKRSAASGAALIITLALLVLFAAMTLAFFSQVTTESRTARTFADSLSTRQLADSAVGIVMSQVREATTVPNGAWASQPGMIRVYGEEGKASEKAHAFYKLYSSDNLTLNAEALRSFDPEKEVPAGAGHGWNHLPALWTDLNEPVTSSPTPEKQAIRYPIFDPEAAGKVEGFELLEDRQDDSGRPARMPVRWLYVLRDGSVTAPNRASEDGQSAIWDPATAETKRRTPSRENPIVGRVAFWADDETSKVNINTAGGFTTKDLRSYQESNFAGSYWDTPRFSTQFDRGGTLDEDTGEFAGGEGGLALCQPLHNEFQRYPGHPATTSLGLVLGNALKSEALYTLLPRLTPGGSRGGTERLLAKTDTELNAKTERLYASVDEFFFGATLDAGRRKTAGAAIAALDPDAPSVLQAERLNYTRPFLTAHSRAPELNLWGRPRMTIWPVHTDTKLRNPTDNLLAFCSTIGPARDPRLFLPQREDPYSPTVDSAIPRNAALYDYLRELTSQLTPGYGKASFAQKYGTDRDQILTEIFDYIRTANLRDSTRDKALPTQAEKDKYKFSPRGIVVPLVFKRDGRETMGFGRFPTISEVSLVFYHAGYVPAAGGKTYFDPSAKRTLGVSANLMRAFVVIETMNPVQGYAPTRAFNPTEAGKNRIIVHELTGLDQFQVTTSAGTRPLGFPAQGQNRNRWASGAAPQGRNFGGAEGFMHRLRDKDSENPAADTWYPFQTKESDAISIPTGETQFSFSGGKVSLRTLFGTLPIQRLELDFPPGIFPVPTDDLWQDPGGFQHPDAKITDVKSLAGRIRWAIQKSNDPSTARRFKQILQPGDTIRSMVAGLKSDPRTTAISREAAPFLAHPLYGQPEVRHAQILRTASGPFYIQGKDTQDRQYTTKFGSLIKLPAGLDYEPDRSPDLPENINGVFRDDQQPGDFDTGLGNLPDGPYTGKPDEGNLAWRIFNQAEGKWDYMHPYYSWKYEDALDTFFSPNRQMISPVMFGSLITGAKRDWETLAFSPNPAGDNHRGIVVEPKDHLLLDLFHMPIVEPYAISEPFSTAGKVNLNFQLASFPWIKRTTALRAVLHASRVTAVPAEDVNVYKRGQNQPPLEKNYRYRINRDETIKGIENVFADYQRRGPDHGFYKSASAICERFLYPEGVTNAGEIKFDPSENRIRDFWKKNTLTGDNVRERPYADLLPRLTTKSNTYTVHLRVQTLRQPRGATEDAYRTWRMSADSVTGEYRGETSIERYIDPEDRRFDRTHPVTSKNKDYLDVDKQSLETAYRFRVIHSKRFAP